MRRRALLIPGGLTSGVLGSRLTRAADPVQSVVRVAFVGPGSGSAATRGINAFRERLSELGWVEGSNLVIESRWGEGSIDRLPALIAEVLARKIDVLVTWGTPAALAARDATRTVPIVATAMGEPLRTGLATSLGRPGGNLTGLSWGGAKASPANGWNCCRRLFRACPLSLLSPTRATLWNRRC